MPSLRSSPYIGLAAVLLAALHAGSIGFGQDRTTAMRPELPPELPAQVAPDHPLVGPWKQVARQLVQIRREIRDYTCVLVKRERIEDVLQEYQYIDVRVKREQAAGDGSLAPFQVRLEYLAPQRLRGRVVVFVEGAHDGQMLVRKGNGLLQSTVLKVAPDSALARRESLLPITDIGFEKMCLSLLGRIELEMQLDPTGANTQVDYFDNARVNDRDCRRIRVTHP